MFATVRLCRMPVLSRRLGRLRYPQDRPLCGETSGPEGSGSGKKMFCIPDNLTIKDTIGGDQNLLGVPYTRKYLYENCIPAMPKIVKDNIKDVVWEWFDENNE